jgi:small subunit ribosomal protein S18
MDENLIQDPTDSLDRIADRTAKKTFFKKRQGCQLCLDKMLVDYKNPSLISKFTSESGRILSLRITGICTKHQRALKKAVKRARMLAILPFTD